MRYAQYLVYMKPVVYTKLDIYIYISNKNFKKNWKENN
jgi:hypothetical protein